MLGLVSRPGVALLRPSVVRDLVEDEEGVLGLLVEVRVEVSSTVRPLT